MARHSKEDAGKTPERGSLAGRLGSIPHSPQPRTPRVDKPQTSAPPKSGTAKPRPATPHKPPRPDVPRRASTVRGTLPAVPAPRTGVAGRLGTFGRGRKRER